METEKYTSAEKLALRFLLPADPADRDDAFDGLVGLCFQAKKNLFVAQQLSGYRVFFSTRDWIREWLEAFFEKYKGRTEQEIREAAEQRAFRYIGRLCYFRMADEIRRRYRRTRRISRIASVTHLHEAQVVLRFIQRHRAAIEREQSTQFYRGLDAMVRWYPVKRKGQTTQAISARCGVNTRESRYIKARIKRVCRESRSGWATGLRNLENSWITAGSKLLR